MKERRKREQPGENTKKRIIRGEHMNAGKMNNQGEELMALIVRLSEEYTHKESSSVTYETAAMLMEAV